MDLYDKLKKYFDETPKEQVLKDWEETKIYDNVNSPTIEQFLLHSVSQRSELFAEQDSKDFILWQRDRDIRRLENGKYKWREFEYDREFFLERYLEYRNKENCG